MALNIVKSLDPIEVKTITMMIYGDPSSWKTSLAFTAKNPILFDFDQGAYRAGVYRKDSVQISKWQEVANITHEDLEGYDTIIVDTVGRALDMITIMLKQDRGNTRRDGELSMQGFGKLGSIFINWLKMIRDMGKDVVLLAHVSEEKDGDNIIKRPEMTGRSKSEAYKVADMMGYLTIENTRDGQARRLNFLPQPDSYLAKDSGNIGNITIYSMDQRPNQLADIIQAVKDHLNSLSEAALQAQKDLDDVRSKLMEAEKAEDYNNLIRSLDVSHYFYNKMRKEIWVMSQKDDAIKFDEQSGQFVDIEAAAEVKEVEGSNDETED